MFSLYPNSYVYLWTHTRTRVHTQTKSWMFGMFPLLTYKPTELQDYLTLPQGFVVVTLTVTGKYIWGGNEELFMQQHHDSSDD